MQVSCPGCGVLATLNHTIDPDGTVSPSLACPVDCGFHDTVRLRGWDDRPQPKRMTVAEFRALGLLQEVNRRLLHPAGMALEVIVGDDGTERFGGVWDYRDDPEGMVFGDGMRPGAREYLDSLTESKREARVKKWGYVVQPVDEELPKEPKA